MALTPDFFQVGRTALPLLITVILRRPASLAGPVAELFILNVHEQAGRQEDVDSPMGGALDGTRRTFHMFGLDCAALPPYIDYEIEKDDGTVWIVKSVDLLGHNNRFRCTTLARTDTMP